MPDKWAQYAQPAASGDKWSQYAQPPATDTTAPTIKQPSMMQQAGTMAEDFGKGVLKGAASTANNLGHMFYPDWLAKHLTGAPSAEQQESYFAPQGTPQKVGKGMEQAAEFFIPGGAEEEAVAMVPKVLRPLAKVAASAVGAGTVNMAQGGDFTTGAAMGAGGQVIGQGLKAMAPAVAEGALNIRKLDRAYGKNGGSIGRAVLDETRGIRPGTIAQSAEDKLAELNPQLNAAADRASVQQPGGASLNPAHDVLSNATQTATRQGERTTAAQLKPMEEHLGETMAGQPIPPFVTPRQLLDLKRGFGNEFIHRWNPDTMTGVKGTAARTYHEMANEFNRVVPEAQGLNTRISNLIPVAKRAASEELNAPTVQRAVHRLAAHTGALTGAGIGGAVGYKEGGVPGAIAGGVTGVLAPELLASPEGQMAAARLLNKVSGLRPVVGTAAQFTKRKGQQ